MNIATDDPLFWRLFAVAQTLPMLKPAETMRWLERAAEQPLTLSTLKGLSLDRLAAQFPVSSQTPVLAQWQQVMGCLAGALPAHLTPFPERAEPRQLRAAFASSDGLAIDGHFGQAKLFFIYAFDDNGPYLQQVRRHRDVADADKEGNEARAQLLSDCHLLFCEAIGGPAAARVIRFNIHPIKIKPPMSIEAQLKALSAMLAERVPPWLAKRLGKTNPLSQHDFTL